MTVYETPPPWAPDAIATLYGWANPKTGELLISRKGLKNPNLNYKIGRPLQLDQEPPEAGIELELEIETSQVEPELEIETFQVEPEIETSQVEPDPVVNIAHRKRGRPKKVQ